MFSGEKVKERRVELGFSQAELAKKLGITRTSYHQWEAGKTQPNKKNLTLLAECLSVDEGYFESEYAIVERYLQLNPRNQKRLEDYADELLASQKKVVPLFAVRVLDDIALSAGPGEMTGDQYQTREVWADQDYAYDVATWIKGTSMEPQYLDGEVALIRETGFDYDGAVYALVVNGESFIKRVYREDEGIRLVSINPEVADRFISYQDEPLIVGKIIGHFMPLEAE